MRDRGAGPSAPAGWACAPPGARAEPPGQSVGPGGCTSEVKVWAEWMAGDRGFRFTDASFWGPLVAGGRGRAPWGPCD